MGNTKLRRFGPPKEQSRRRSLPCPRPTSSCLWRRTSDGLHHGPPQRWQASSWSRSRPDLPSSPSSHSRESWQQHPSCSPPSRCQRTSARLFRRTRFCPQPRSPWSHHCHGTSCWTHSVPASARVPDLLSSRFPSMHRSHPWNPSFAPCCFCCCCRSLRSRFGQSKKRTWRQLLRAAQGEVGSFHGMPSLGSRQGGEARWTELCNTPSRAFDLFWAQFDQRQTNL